MKIKAFTLIEVLVTMTIISILLGILTPAVWKFWESEEIAATRERMREIRKGLVGDKSLVQNGVRTHYGFVGDNGELPFRNYSSDGGLNYLISKPVGGYPYWNGPYLTGFGADWNKDAWGRPFKYQLTMDTYGRYVSAELRSAGPDGVFGNDDDIFDPDVQIYERDVTPTNRISGNIFGNFSGLAITMKFKDPTDSSGISTKTVCKLLTPVTGYSNYTTLFAAALNPIKLPVGGVEITTVLNKKSNCSDAISLPANSFKYFVSDNINQIILPELR